MIILAPISCLLFVSSFVTQNEETAVRISSSEETSTEMAQTISSGIQGSIPDSVSSEVQSPSTADWRLAADSLISENSDLRDSIRSLNAEICRLNKDASYFDMLRLRYANGRLELPYDKGKIEEAIELFDGVTNAELKEKHHAIRELLTEYGSSLEEIKSILISFQDNIARKNPFALNREWISQAKAKLKESSYCHEREEREKQRPYYSIPYIDRVIDTALKRLENAANNRSVDFADLIEQLNVTNNP